MWGPDVPVVDPQIAMRHFAIAVASFISFGFFVKHVLTQDPPAVRREYPYNGLIRELGGQEETKVRLPFLDIWCCGMLTPGFVTCRRGPRVWKTERSLL